MSANSCVRVSGVRLPTGSSRTRIDRAPQLKGAKSGPLGRGLEGHAVRLASASKGSRLGGRHHLELTSMPGHLRHHALTLDIYLGGIGQLRSPSLQSK
jgi:hypothetical protein